MTAPGIRSRLKNAVGLWLQVLQLLRYSSRRLSILVTVLTLAEAVVGLAVLYSIKLLIEVITAEIGAAEGSVADPTPVFGYLLLTGTGLLLAVVVRSLAALARTAQGMRISDYIDREIHARAIEVDLSFYESPHYFDSLERARQAGSQRPAELVSSALLLAKTIVFLVAILILIAGIDWRLLPAILVTIALVLAIRLYFTRALHDLIRTRAQLERRAAYVDWLLTSDIHAKELRLGNLGAHLRELYSALRHRIRGERMTIEKRRAAAEFAVSFLGALIFAGATAFLVFRAVAGDITIGDLVLFVLLFRRAESSGQEMVRHLTTIYDDQLFLQQLFDFLAVQPRIVAPADPALLPKALSAGLRIEGVDFRYPDNVAPTLAGIDLHLPPGKVVALVGENGSGKTSLIKLLTRLYDPDRGCITLEGQDVRDFDPVAYRRLFSVVFQDYARYAVTARENIRYGDVRRDADDPGVAAAARLSGAADFLSDLPQGLDTGLTRIFDDGQEISIGQWQRIALARAFFPRTRFIIMDEPTSALDPKAEFELFENFRQKLEGRGALIISHRLSTVRMADYTYVLDRGRIAEHGTHDDLVATGGRYAQLFEKQGRNYRL